MIMRKRSFHLSSLALAALAAAWILFSPARAVAQHKITVDWQKTVADSKTTPTLQVVVNPLLERGSSIHEGTFTALKNLGCEMVRFVPWFPYPHMAVAELKPPTATETFWDFSKIDPIMEDFMKATEGHSVLLNFSTIPAWMFESDKPVAYPEDPNQVFWAYNPGVTFRDTTFKELADYFVRLFQWYTQGGFTDELGKFHRSGYHYKIPYWEVLNEPDLEHHFTPESYTRLYDVVVTALKAVSPDTKFVALGLAYETNPKWFTYFLDPAHHRKGIELQGISYHFYGGPHGAHRSPEDYRTNFFDQADGFLNRVRYIEEIRKRLAPGTFTTIDEIGNILGDQTGTGIAPEYWNLSGAMYAYLYLELTKIGIDYAGESQLVGYPTQFPSVSMMNWKTGHPNARYWVLWLLKNNFGPGDKLVATGGNTGGLHAQGFQTPKGKKLLVINPTGAPVKISLPEGASSVSRVNVSSGDNPPVTSTLRGAEMTVAPYEVSVVSF